MLIWPVGERAGLPVAAVERAVGLVVAFGLAFRGWRSPMRLPSRRFQCLILVFALFARELSRIRANFRILELLPRELWLLSSPLCSGKARFSQMYLFSSTLNQEALPSSSLASLLRFPHLSHYPSSSSQLFSFSQAFFLPLQIPLHPSQSIS